MNPTPLPTPNPAAGTEPVIEFVRTNRPVAGGVLLALAAVCLGLTVWMAVKSFGKPAETPAATELDLPKPADAVDLNRPAYILGGVLALAGTLLLGIAGVWTLVSIPPADPAKQRAEIRLVLLAALGLLGLVLIVGGALYLYVWFDDLTALIARNDWKRAVRPVGALVGILVGAGLVLVGILPSRADERDKPAVRRVVYGSNLALTSLLLVIALVIGNVAAAVKLSNRLDVTESALAAVSEPTRAFLQAMAEPVTAYHITRESERTDDVRRLLDRMAEESRGKLTVRTVQPEYNRTEFQALMKKYPPVEREIFGLLLTSGPDEKKFRFIPQDDLFTTVPDPDAGAGGRGGRQVFKGEPELYQALAALVEGDRKSVVYFTQGSRELDIGGTAAPEQSAGTLKAYLEKNQLDVRPLPLDPLDPKVPADAAMVVVANPRTPLDPKAVDAIRKYMTDPGPEKRSGRLLVLAGANPAPPAGTVAPTGLEPLLQEMGVALGNEFVFSVPMQGGVGLAEVFVAPPRAAMTNPVAQLYADGAGPWAWCRTVTAAPAGPGGTYAPSVLFETTPPRRATWLEPTVPTDLRKAFEELVASEAVQKQKQVAGARPVAAVVAQGTTPRAVVFGCADMVTDKSARPRGGLTNPNLELVGATVDWLRERPAIAPGVTGKDVRVYRMNPTADGTRLVILPIALILLTVAGLGVGVWVIRRRQWSVVHGHSSMVGR